jgi:hypothetical protein
MRARTILLAAACAFAGCTSPREALIGLDELYQPNTIGGKDAAAERAVYASTDEPVEDALDGLAVLFETDEDDLDLIERARAIALVAEIGRVDPSRIVRARAYDTALHLWRALPPGDEHYAVGAIDENALDTGLDPLLQLAKAATEEERAAVLDARGAEIERGAKLLAGQRPQSFDLAHKLLLLATRCGRFALETEEHEAPAAALEAAARALAFQVAFLAARPEFSGPGGRGVADHSMDVRISAGRLLFALDAAAATLELGKEGGPELPIWTHTSEMRARVAWLQSLEESGLAAAAVHPTLRAPLALDLVSEDAAVRVHARSAIARLLRLDAKSSDVEALRGRWLALGEWDPKARS